MKKHLLWISLPLTLALLAFYPLFSQTEVEPWGNITGIRIDGQLLQFETHISLVQKDGSRILSAGKERQRPMYARMGNAQIISSNIDSLTQTVT